MWLTVRRCSECLSDAIKSVYASVFYSDSKAYMTATSNVIDQEKMAVIIQEVVGVMHAGLYFPSFSGVGRSLNYYPLGNETAEDGVAQVAVGLGKTIVEGGTSLRFSPRHPDKVLQTSTLDLALRDTQTRMIALDMRQEASSAFTAADDFNLRSLRVQEVAQTGALKYMVSTFDVNDQVLRDNDSGAGAGGDLCKYAQSWSISAGSRRGIYACHRSECHGSPGGD